MGNVWQVFRGEQAAFTVTICDGQGAPIAYGGSEALAGVVWPGGTLPAVGTLAPTWSAPTLGQVAVPIPPTLTQPLAAATYQVLLTVTDGTGTHDCYLGQLEVSDVPGADAARPTYCDVTDLRRLYSEVDSLLNPDRDKAGFADQCADARDWLDQCILRNYAGGYASLLGMHGYALDQWSYGGAMRSQLDSVWLRDRLAADCLIVTTRIREVCAHQVLSTLFLRNPSKGSDYLALGTYHRAEAFRKLINTTAQLSLNRDGVPNVPITFQSSNSLFA